MRGVRVGRSATRGATSAIVVMALLGGCAGMPDGSPVRAVEENDDVAGSTVRYDPAPPRPGANPQQVVRGYLDAMLAYPVSRAVAAEYLTPDADEDWRPSARTEVLRDPEIGLPQDSGRSGTTVELTRHVVADLDAQGRRTARDEPDVDAFRLERVDGEWRISNPPPGLLVTEKFADDYIRPFPIYYFDGSGTRLVPDLVHLVVGDTLPTALVTSLARGPSSESSAAQTFVPPVEELRPSVPISREGVAEVEFSGDMEDLSGLDVQRLSAQLVWTLRRLEGVEGVRLLGVTGLRLPGGSTVQSLDSWGRYAPREPSGGPWAVVGDAVVEVPGGEVRAFDGPWGEDGAGVVRAAVSERRVAALLTDGDTVRLGQRDGTDLTDVPGEGVLDFSWTPDDELVLLDRPDGATRVRLLGGGEARTPDTVGLGRVRTLRLSPEGGRYLALDDRGRVLIGGAVRDRDDRITALTRPRVLEVDRDGLRSPVWVDSTRVAFLAATDLGRQVHTVNIDGSDLDGGVGLDAALLPDVDPRTLVLGQDDEVRWVLDVRGRLWFLGAGGSWSRVDSDQVTSLSPRG